MMQLSYQFPQLQTHTTLLVALLIELVSGEGNFLMYMLVNDQWLKATR